MVLAWGAQGWGALTLVARKAVVWLLEAMVARWDLQGVACWLQAQAQEAEWVNVAVAQGVGSALVG